MSIFNELQERKSKDLDYEPELTVFRDSMNSLKYKYMHYIKEYRFNEEEDELEKLYRVKKRVRNAALFWTAFYIIGSGYVSHKLNYGLLGRFSLQAFFILPNMWFYQQKFKDVNSKINDFMLHKHLSYIPIDNDLKQNFFKLYKDFFLKNELKI